MRIKELADRVGVTPRAVRFYEAQGALPRPRRMPNGYRDYSAADEERLRLLLGLRALDLPLEHAGTLSALCASGQCGQVADELVELVAMQRARIAERQRDLDHLDARLTLLLRQLLGGAPPRPLIRLGKEDTDGDL